MFSASKPCRDEVQPVRGGQIKRIADQAPCKTSPRGESLHSSWRALNACSEGNRYQLAPLLAYTLESGVFLTARALNLRRWSPAFGGAMTQGRARETHGRENGHDHIIVIVLVVLLLGGGGFFYRRRA